MDLKRFSRPGDRPLLRPQALVLQEAKRALVPDDLVNLGLTVAYRREWSLDHEAHPELSKVTRPC